MNRSGMEQVVVVEEWDPDRFHQRVLELQNQGYVTRQESYKITPTMDPDTGAIRHFYRIEMHLPETDS